MMPQNHLNLNIEYPAESRVIALSNSRLIFCK